MGQIHIHQERWCILNSPMEKGIVEIIRKVVSSDGKEQRSKTTQHKNWPFGPHVPNMMPTLLFLHRHITHIPPFPASRLLQELSNFSGAQCNYAFHPTFLLTFWILMAFSVWPSSSFLRFSFSLSNISTICWARFISAT